MLKKLVDLLAAGAVTAGAPLFRKVGNWPGDYPAYRRRADKAGVHWRSTHYYHPTYTNDDLPRDVTVQRDLPGLDLHEDEQLALLAAFDYQDELARLADPGDPPNPARDYTYDNNQYGPVDADCLYAMLRAKKPGRVFEIGSGNSSRVAAKALALNAAENAEHTCRHVCIEPYEMEWLEQLGSEIIRKRIEDVPLTLFDELEAGDVLFIDSSHVIRPFGDVLVEFQLIIPRLKSGVLVHVHDIFTPRDYPEKWLREDRRLWNEQYLLEVMLSHSARYKTVLAMNWLANTHRAKVEAAFPILAKQPNAQPGAFWFEVV